MKPFWKYDSDQIDQNDANIFCHLLKNCLGCLWKHHEFDKVFTSASDQLHSCPNLDC